jgi:hypothetical protein
VGAQSAQQPFLLGIAAGRFGCCLAALPVGCGPAQKDEVSKEVDKQAAWNTAWVGGIPLEYLQQGKAELKVLRLLKGFGRVVRVTVRATGDG